MLLLQLGMRVGVSFNPATNFGFPLVSFASNSAYVPTSQKHKDIIRKVK